MFKQLKLDQQSGDGSLSSDNPGQKTDSSLSISLSFINEYQDILSANKGFEMIISFTLLGFYLFLILTFFILIFIQRHKMEKQLPDQSLIHKIFGCILVVFNKALYLPMIEYIIRGFNAYSRYDLGTSIGLGVLNTLSLIAYLMLIFYARRIYKLCMLSDKAPWSGSNSNAIYFGFLAKIINPLILSIDLTGTYIYVEIIISMLIQILYLAMILFFADIYNRRSDLLHKFFQGTVVLILEIGVIKYLIKDNDSKEFLLFLCIISFQLYFIYRVNNRRKERLLEQYNQGELKMELQHEYLLLYLQELVKDSLVDSKESEEYYSEILKLLECHQLKCYDLDCICTKQQEFMDIFKQGQRQASTVFYVDTLSVKKIKQYIQQKSGKWFISGINRMKEDIITDKYAKILIEENLSLIEDLSKEDFSEIGIDIKQVRIKAQKTVQVETQHVKNKFITNFILVFFNEIRQKFPHSLKIHFLCNYYSMFIVKKPQLCISQLRSYNHKNQSWLDKISKFVNEFYILHEYERQDKSKADEILQVRVDGEHYIKINDLYEQFHTQIDQLSCDTVEFWKGFTVEQVDPYKQYEIGEKIADSIQFTYKTFREIEHNLMLKDYKIYVWFAQIQLKIMNDIDGYQIFIQKMRGVLQMNKMFQKNFKGKQMNEDSGFIVSDGHSNSNGKIIFMNKTIKRWLLREEEDSKFLNINSLMPKLIGERHDEFMKVYNDTGDSVMLNKQILNFMIDKNGSIFPVDLLIKFHYSQKFQYCFISFVNTVKDLIPFKDKLKYKQDQLVFMAIDLIDGQIYEVSKNFLGLLDQCGFNQYKDIREVSFTEKKRTLSDILINFQLEDLNLYKNKGVFKKEFYELDHYLDLSSFSDNIDDVQNSGIKELKAKVAIYSESYGQGKLDIGFVVLSLNSSEKSFNLNEQQSEDIQFKEQQLIFEEKYNEFENESLHSSSVGSQSSESSAQSYHAIQQFHTFYRQQTPKILKIVIQLILFMFIVSITIGTVNLVLNIKSHNLSELEVRQVRSSIDRVNFSVSIRVILRVLLNIANGYEPNQSKLIDDRFKVYQQLLKGKAEQLINAQYYLDNSGYQYSEDFAQQLALPQITMQYLMENNRLKTENVTMRNMQSLFGSRLVQIENYTQSQMKGNLYIQNLKPNTSANYKPTEEEQTLYFIVYNGNGVVRQYNRFFADMYIIDSVKNSADNESQTQITTIISVLTIFLVTCIISPIISKTEERKYNALVFFLKIPMQEVDVYIKNCQECQNLDIQEQSQKKLKFGPSSLQNMQSIEQYGSVFCNDESQDMQDLKMMYENSMLETTQKKMLDESSTRLNLINTHSKLKLNLENSKVQNDQSEDNEDQAESILSIQKKNKEARKNIKNKKNNSIVSDLSSLHPAFQNEKLKEPKQKTEEIVEEILLNNLQKIKSIAFRQKTITFMFVMIFMIIFSVYFIISFFMAQKNYQTAASSSYDLGIIFNKEQCFENLFSYQRENQIRNQTLKISDDNITDASANFLLQCSSQEAYYKELRKQQADYFQDAKSYMDAIETSQYCESVFQNDHAYLNGPCKIALNGLLNKGMTNTLFFMLNQAQKTELAFTNALQTRNRDEAFLKTEIANSDFIESMDAKMYVMSQSFIELENQCMNSALGYFKKLLSDFIVVYSIFISLLIGSMIYFTIFAFKRLRKSMWSTNMLLKIIPKQALKKYDSELLKQFFVN